jgi:hypothetical protein
VELSGETNSGSHRRGKKGERSIIASYRKIEIISALRRKILQKDEVWVFN